MSRTSRNTRLGAATIGGIIAFAAVGGGLVACQGNSGGVPQPSGTPTTSSSSTPSASATTSSSAEDEAVVDAEYTLRDYYRVTGLSRQAPDDFNIEDFKKVAISSALFDAQNLYNTYVMTGTTETGDVKVEVVEVREVDLTSKPKAKPQPIVPAVQFLVCLDSSEVNTMDKDGKSLNKPDRQVRNLFRIGLRNDDYPDGTWLMSYTDPQEGKSC